MNDKMQKSNETAFPRCFKLRLSDKAVELLYGRAAAHGITPEELLENFIGDLIDGTACTDWDNYEVANEWFDSRYFSPYDCPTFLAYLIREMKLPDFYELYDEAHELAEEIKYVLADKRISEKEKDEVLAYYMQLINADNYEIGKMYSDYSDKKPRRKNLADEVKNILDFRRKLKNAIAEKCDVE